MGKEANQKSGIKAALMMWGFMFLSCIIDKLALNGNYILEIVTLILAPLILLSWYVYQCIKNNPDSAVVKQWHIQYIVTFIICNIIGYIVMMLFLVFNNHSETIQLSGGGIIIYGIPGLIGFLIIALIFQIIRKKSKS